MKTLCLALSLTGLIMVSCTLKAEEAVSSTDAEVLALVDAAAKAEKKTEAEMPVFKNPLETKKEKSTSGFWQWARMIGSLAIVLALFVGGLYAFRNLPAGRSMAGKARMIQVLAQHHIGTKKSIAVIRVAGETVLVGITDNNINLIKTLSLLDEDTQTNLKFNSTLSQKMNQEEELSMKGIKDLIGSKLKTMKDLS